MIRHRHLWRVLPLAAAIGFLSLPLWAQEGDPPPLGLPGAGKIDQVPLGELAGGAESDAAARIDNSDTGKQEAIGRGRMLWVRLNCADCHGFEAKGSMGPNLTDKFWLFGGGTPATIYKAIYGGMPEGMPAWGKALPPSDIWQLVAYIQSLGGACAAHNYQACLQGDRIGEQVAPEVDFEQSLNGSPKYQPPSNTAKNGQQ